jgi:hypothetical protein
MDDHTPTITLREAGLDYLTLTSRDPNATHLANVALELFATTHADGDKRREWSWMGYQGWCNRTTSWGNRHDGQILRVSGPLADLAFPKAYPHADSCSRIDLQVTAEMPRGKCDLASGGYHRAVADARRRGAPLKVSLIVNSDGGQTLYLGSRKSELFARLYNKEAESGDPHWARNWRWELECKGQRAQVAARGFQLLSDPRRALLLTVFRHFHDRGVTPPWPLVDGETLPVPKAPRSNDQRRLDWLATQVKPALDDLRQRYDPDHLVRILGLAPGFHPYVV